MPHPALRTSHQCQRQWLRPGRRQATGPPPQSLPPQPPPLSSHQTRRTELLELFKKPPVSVGPCEVGAACHTLNLGGKASGWVQWTTVPRWSPGTFHSPFVPLTGRHLVEASSDCSLLCHTPQDLPYLNVLPWKGRRAPPPPPGTRPCLLSRVPTPPCRSSACDQTFVAEPTIVHDLSKYLLSPHLPGSCGHNDVVIRLYWMGSEMTE